MLLALLILAAFAAGAVAGVLWARGHDQEVPGDGPVTDPAPRDTHTGLARRSIELMALGVVVVDEHNNVVIANKAASSLGVRGDDGLVKDLMRLARRARHDGRAHSGEVELPTRTVTEPATADSPVRIHEATAVNVEASPIGISGHVALFLEDMSRARLVDAVRRDFVANVSHELKTPVGALALLAEAIVTGYDSDPDEVRHFAERMKHESSRLARLVQDLIDLSRLQGADVSSTPDSSDAVGVNSVIGEAVDRSRLAADARAISVFVGDADAMAVRGSEAQLVTALCNLVDNAIAYSPEHTQVKISADMENERIVALSVTDQGVGIAEADLSRVFERFYRADPARSRDTGGTGLGLAIVKHIATNHGGGVRVRSRPGEGSTFTLLLPLALSSVDKETA